jgi:hypothetical protein
MTTYFFVQTSAVFRYFHDNLIPITTTPSPLQDNRLLSSSPSSPKRRVITMTTPSSSSLLVNVRFCLSFCSLQSSSPSRSLPGQPHLRHIFKIPQHTLLHASSINTIISDNTKPLITATTSSP